MASNRSSGKQRIVVVGAGGRLGTALTREYSRTHAVTGLARHQLDLADPSTMREVLAPLTFDVLINCAAQTNVDRCESHPEEAFALNAEAPGVLAEICDGRKAKLIHISTDYVFDGEKTEAYTEDDLASPISVYGESKLAGEQRVLGVSERHLVVRVSWVFGPDRPSFVDWAVQRAQEHEQLESVADKWSTPSYTLDLAEMLQRLMMNEDAAGVFHLTNRGSCSWQEYAQWAIDCCRAEGVPLKAQTVGKITLADMKNFVAKRPVHTMLSAARYEGLTGHAPRHWREAVADFVRTKFVPEASSRN